MPRGLVYCEDMVLLSLLQNQHLYWHFLTDLKKNIKIKVVSVGDAGSPISQTEVSHLFQEYVQVCPQLHGSTTDWILFINVTECVCNYKEPTL